MSTYKLTDGDKALVEAIAGVLGSLTATCTMFPLDTARARVQASLRADRRRRQSTGELQSAAAPAQGVLSTLESMAREEGVSSLYRGIGIRAVHCVSQAFVFFFTFNLMRRKLEARKRQKIGWGTSIGLGLLAGWCNTLITEPLDVIAIITQTTPCPKRPSQAGTEEEIARRTSSCSSLKITAEDIAPSALSDGGSSDGGSSPDSAKSDRGGDQGRNGFAHAHARSDCHAHANGALANGHHHHHPDASDTGSRRSISPPLPRALSPLPVINRAGKRPNLYSSLYVSLLLAATPAIQSTVFEQARLKLITRRVAGGGANSIGAFEAFLIGAAAKGCAASIMYPAIRTKVLLQAGTSTSTSIRGTLQGIVDREGMRGLYRGIQAQIVSAFLVGAILLTVKEKTFGAAYVAVRWLQSQRLAAKTGRRLGAAPQTAAGPV